MTPLRKDGDPFENTLAENTALRAERDQLRALLFDASTILEYVSRGRGFVDVEPYPDATARRVLGAIVELGGDTWEPSSPTE